MYCLLFFKYFIVNKMDITNCIYQKNSVILFLYIVKHDCLLHKFQKDDFCSCTFKRLGPYSERRVDYID